MKDLTRFPAYVMARTYFVANFEGFKHISAQTINDSSKAIQKYAQNHPEEEVPQNLLDFLIYMIVEKGMFQNAVAEILGHQNYVNKKSCMMHDFFVIE